MLMVIYSADLDDDVMEILEKERDIPFTKIERVLGRGRKEKPKMNNATWPGFNNMVMVWGNAEKRAKTVFKKLHRKLGGRGIKLVEIPTSEEL